MHSMDGRRSSNTRICPEELWVYCKRLSQPIAESDLSRVKVAYFSMAGHCEDLLICALTFILFLARLGGHEEPVGWMHFRPMLDRQSRRCRRLSEAEQVHADAHSDGPLARSFRLAMAWRPTGPVAAWQRSGLNARSSNLGCEITEATQLIDL